MKDVTVEEAVYQETNLRVRLQSFTHFVRSNCATPEITVTLDNDKGKKKKMEALSAFVASVFNNADKPQAAWHRVRGP